MDNRSLCLITGIGGFVGEHLKSLLESKGLRVIGIEKNPTEESVNVYKQDIVDTNGLSQIIAKEKPQYIYHLAAIASTAKAASNPEETKQINTKGIESLLLAIQNNLDNNYSPRVLLVGSIEEIGPDLYSSTLITEQTPLNPSSPYGQSKKDAYLVFKKFAQAGMDILWASPVNHTGAGQRTGFLCPDVVSQMAKIEKDYELGIKCDPIINTGDLSAIKNFLNVKDVVQAYFLLMEKGRSGERYLVAGNNNIFMRDFVNKIMTLYKFQDKFPLSLQEKINFEAPKMVMSKIDYSKLSKDTGWLPVHTLDEALFDLVESYRHVN